MKIRCLAGLLYFNQIFGHWKTLLLFLFRLSARTLFPRATGFPLHTYPNYGKAQNSFFSEKKSLTNSLLYVCINKMLTRCNQTETFLLIEKTNRHCLPFLFSYVIKGFNFSAVCLYNHFTLYTFFFVGVGLCVGLRALLFGSLILCNHKRFQRFPRFHLNYFPIVLLKTVLIFFSSYHKFKFMTLIYFFVSFLLSSF